MRWTWGGAVLSIYSWTANDIGAGRQAKVRSDGKRRERVQLLAAHLPLGYEHEHEGGRARTKSNASGRMR